MANREKVTMTLRIKNCLQVERVIDKVEGECFDLSFEGEVPTKEQLEVIRALMPTQLDKVDKMIGIEALVKCVV